MLKEILSQFSSNLLFWVNPNLSEKSIIIDNNENNIITFIGNLCPQLGENESITNTFKPNFSIGYPKIIEDIIDNKKILEISLDNDSLVYDSEYLFNSKFLKTNINSHQYTILFNLRFDSSIDRSAVFTLFQSGMNLFQCSIDYDDNLFILLSRMNSNPKYEMIQLEENPFTNKILIITSENPHLIKIYSVNENFSSLGKYHLTHSEELDEDNCWGYNVLEQTSIGETSIFSPCPFFFKDMMFFNKALKPYEIFFILNQFKKFYSDKLFSISGKKEK